MMIDLTKLSTPALLELLRDVSREIDVRVSTPVERRVHAVEPVIVVREPGEADKQLCLHVAQRLRRGDYIRAADRQRVAEIASEYGAWVQKQGLPTDGGTGSWRKAADRYRIGFAQER